MKGGGNTINYLEGDYTCSYCFEKFYKERYIGLHNSFCLPECQLAFFTYCSERVDRAELLRKYNRPVKCAPQPQQIRHYNKNGKKRCEWLDPEIYKRETCAYKKGGDKLRK